MRSLPDPGTKVRVLEGQKDGWCGGTSLDRQGVSQRPMSLNRRPQATRAPTRVPALGMMICITRVSRLLSALQYRLILRVQVRPDQPTSLSTFVSRALHQPGKRAMPASHSTFADDDPGAWTTQGILAGRTPDLALQTFGSWGLLG